MIGTTAIATLAILLPTAPAASRPAADVGRMAEADVLEIACAAHMGQYVMGLRLDPGSAEVAFDDTRRRWVIQFIAPAWAGRARTGTHVVHLLDPARPVFRVAVDDATGTIVEQTILEDGRPVTSMGEALTLVRTSDLVGAWLTRYEGAWLYPEYRVHGGGWLVRVHVDDRRVGNVWVLNGHIVGSEGPWNRPPGRRRALYEAWLRIQPALSFKLVAFLCAAIVLGLLIDPRRLLSVRMLDAIVLTAFVPVMLTLYRLPSVGYLFLMAATVYFVVRALIRVGRARPNGWPQRRPAAALLILLIAVGAWQVAHQSKVERGQSEFAGVMGGAWFYEYGWIPYGHALSGRDVYGPFHFVLYGLAEQAFPCRVSLGTPDIENLKGHADLTASRVLAVLFHVLCVVSLVGLGKRLGGGRHGGLLLAAVYVLLSVGLGRFFTASRVPPAALITAGLWLWPNPVAAALCLGLASADMWFPIFLFPLWLGSFRGRDRARFLATYLAVGAVFLGISLMGPGGPIERFRVLVERAVQREGIAPGKGWLAPTGYFWGLFPVGAVWPAVLRRGVSLVYFAACLFAFWRPRRPGRFALVALSAALIAATQLWKPARGGEYVSWYLPMLLVTLFGAPTTARPADAATAPAPPPAPPPEARIPPAPRRTPPGTAGESGA